MCKVCCECIDEEHLKLEIASSGVADECEYCGSDENPAIEMSELAEQVHSVLETHYYITSSEPEGLDYFAAKEGCWEQSGEPVTYAIMNLIESSEELAEAIREYLSDQYDPWGKDATIESSPYASDSQYEERDIETYEFQESWSFFRKEIFSRSRFFNQAARLSLEHIFAGIDQLTTHKGESVIRFLSQTDSIFRARIAKTTESLDEILRDAPRSLGAPPSRYATSGRMNAEGISVFYGAENADTCIAEIRAPVGSSVVIGKFSPTRKLCLLDLTRLNGVFLRGSFFNSEHTQSLSRVHFLKRLVDELSQPVIPGAELRDYIPTQVVAEYWAAHPDMKLDGVMFASSQAISLGNTDSDSEEQYPGTNIVLFSHACGLEHYELPAGTEVEVSRNIGDPDDEDHSIWIWEKVPDNDQQEGLLIVENNRLDFGSSAQLSGIVEEQRETSIRLDMESVEVRRIEGIRYQASTIDVTRHRLNQEMLNNSF